MQNIQLEHPFLVAQDLSAIGSLSLSVANPILAAFGSPLAVLQQVCYLHKRKALTHRLNCQRIVGLSQLLNIGNNKIFNCQGL